MEDKCVICGELIPEGRQICKRCEVKWNAPVVVDDRVIPDRSRVRDLPDRDHIGE